MKAEEIARASERFQSIETHEDGYDWAQLWGPELLDALEAAQREIEIIKTSEGQLASKVEGLKATLAAERIQWAAVKANADKACAENARLRAALEWYGQEWLYDMPSFTTSVPTHIHLADSIPFVSVSVEGSPVAHDRGKTARAALAGDDP